MNERVLITGASGFLGYHLILAALEKKLLVYAAVRKSSDIRHLKDKGIQFVYLDYEDIVALRKVLTDKQINYVIHAAGVTKAISEQVYINVNTGYSVNLARAIDVDNGFFKKLAFISSLAANGPLTTTDGMLTERVNPAPVTAYGRSKLMAEMELGKMGIPLTILRPTAVYGPRDKDIFIMLKTINKGFDPYIGSIGQRLSFVYAGDVATVAVNALFVQQSGTYLISDGNSYNRYQFADITKRLLQKKALRFHLPMPLVKLLAGILETSNGLMKKPAVINREKLHELAAKNWVCDISKAKAELNFNPAFNLESGLQESIRWYKANKLL